MPHDLRPRVPSRSSAQRRARSGALRLADVGVLVAVGVVVLLVSLPRLRDFALRENESDAQSLVARLGHACDGASTRCADVRALVASDTALARELDDVEFLEGGALLRRHGYLFELLDRDAASEAGARVRAWPWEYRKTGCSAFAWTAPRTVLAHANEQGLFSGLTQRPVPSADGASWRALGAQ